MRDISNIRISVALLLTERSAFIIYAHPLRANPYNVKKLNKILRIGERAAKRDERKKKSNVRTKENRNERARSAKLIGRDGTEKVLL